MTEYEDLPGEQADDVLFELYHEASKQRPHDLAFAQRIFAVNHNEQMHEVLTRAFKFYPGARAANLPRVAPDPGVERALAERRSIRRFTGAALSLDQLTRLVSFAAGVTGTLDPTGGGVVQPVRAAPSGGALYPVELYVLLSAVDGLEPGVYHYRVDRHAIEMLREGDPRARLSQQTSDPETFTKAAVTFALTANFGRSHFKYGERAYRFSLLEAGHLCQNLLLMATSLGLGAVPVGGFLDDDLHDLLGVDGVDEAAIYLVATGVPALRPAAGAAGLAQTLADRIISSLAEGP